MTEAASHEILQDIHAMELELIRYERTYGVLTEVFYEAYSRGEEPEDSGCVGDFALWAGAYETLRERRAEYERHAAAGQLEQLGVLFKQAA
jgi:hypothetical protein